MSILEIKNLEIQYQTDDGCAKAVNRIDFALDEGDTLGLVGETGAGKTTTALGIMRLVPDPPGKYVSGEIIFDGKKINGYLSHSEKNDLIRRIQMIFQDPAASLNERATVDYILSEGLYNFHLYKDEEERKAKIKEIIKEL